MAPTEQDNKEHVRRFNEEVWGQYNFEAIDDLVADDFVGHNPALPEPVRGPDGVRDVAETLHTAFPDCEVELEEVIADGDWLAQRITATGTHDGEFMGIEPTGKQVELTGMNITRLEESKWVEGYELWDMFGLLQQLGVVEPPRSNVTRTMVTTPQENKELVQRFITEVVNGGNYELVDELFTADYARHDPDTPADEQGPDPFIEALQQLHEAFPDEEVHIDEIIAEDDLVAFEGTMTGTHEGTFRGVEPTYTAIEIPGNAMHRIRDGRIAETWATWNFLGAFQQLGVRELQTR